MKMRSSTRQSAVRIGLDPEELPGTCRYEPDQIIGRRT
jgi:hypothetical protein